MTDLKVGDIVKTKEGKVGRIVWIYDNSSFPSEYRLEDMAYLVLVELKYEHWLWSGLKKIEENFYSTFINREKERIKVGDWVEYKGMDYKVKKVTLGLVDLESKHGMFHAFEVPIQRVKKIEPPAFEKIKVRDWVESSSLPECKNLFVLREMGDDLLVCQETPESHEFYENNFFTVKRDSCKKISKENTEITEIKEGDEVWVKGMVSEVGGKKYRIKLSNCDPLLFLSFGMGQHREELIWIDKSEVKK